MYRKIVKVGTYSILVSTPSNTRLYSLSQFKCNFIVFILCFIFLWALFSGRVFLGGGLFSEGDLYLYFILTIARYSMGGSGMTEHGK